MVPREITNDMVTDFRTRIRADNSAGISDTEIRTGLAAVFAGHVWPELPTTIDEDGWSRKAEAYEAQQALADAGQRVAAAAESPPVISDAQWRCSAAQIIGNTWQGANLPPGALEKMSAQLAAWIKTGEMPS